MKIRLILFTAMCLWFSNMPAQGIVLNQGKTKAVVIGISDYKNEGIEDLKYAHRDALAFASFLESSSGGNLKKDEDYKLLINEQATSANMSSALDWLLNVCKPKDNAIIYFSGHGDVESQTVVKHGFLLTYDSPAKVYVARAYPVFYLQSIVKTLSGKDIDVLLIADACRAGKLAGSEHNGAQAASSVLAQQLAKEVKILSCQTDEFSEESSKWGGGRGLFSYYLIRGLYGLADRNEDKQVTLMELTSYLTENVSSNAQNSQIPKTDGSPKKVVSKVDDDMVKKLMAEPESQPLASAEVTTRGMSKPIEDAKEKVKELVDEAKTHPGPGGEVNEETDYLNQARDILINQFWYALDNGNLRSGDEYGSAADYFSELNDLVDDEESEEQAYNLGVELIWALRDEVDEVIEANLDSRFFYEDDIDASLDMVDDFAFYMEEAIEILGEDHYMADHLRGKMYYMKALGDALFADLAQMDADSLIRQSISYNLKALEYDDAAAYIYNDLGSAYARLGDNRQAISYYNIALDLSPSWQIALANLYSNYLEVGKYDEAEEVKQRVLALESDNPWIFYSFGNSYYEAEMYDEALTMYHKAASMQSDNYQLYSAMGICYYYGKGDQVKAEEYYRKALKLSPNAYWPSLNLANLLYANYRHDEAEQIVLNTINKQDYKVYFYELLGSIYTATGKMEEGFANYSKVVELDPDYPNGYINMMYYYAIFGEYEMAFEWMESALATGYSDVNYLRTFSTYEIMRTDPRYEQLIAQYLGN